MTTECESLASCELLASCWTTAGNVGPMWPSERSPFDLRGRIEAAAAAGFTGFGLVHADLVAARDEIGYPNLRALLTDCGITHVEVEMLTGWYRDGPARGAAEEVRRDLLIAATALGARHIKAGGAIDEQVEWDRFVTEFHQLCADAAHAGTRIAFEPMPFGNVATLAEGRRLIDDADHNAGGLMLDLWHMARAGVALSDIETVPARYVFAVELDDADTQIRGTLLDDTLNHRRLCGEGDQDVAGFIQAIRASGFRGPWGVEILSERFRTLSLTEQVRTAYQSTHDALIGQLNPPGTVSR